MVQNTYKFRELDLPDRVFALDPKKRKSPSRLDCDFVSRKTRFHYGFEYDRNKIIREWLYALTIVDRAIARLNELTRISKRKDASSYDKEFEAWAVFDADNHARATISIATQKARANGVNVAFSNPCFEVWALMHFMNVDGPLSHKQAQSALKKVMPEYDHGKGAILEYKAMRSNYAVAVQRGERSISRRQQEGSPRGNPYTDVHILTETIRNFRTAF
jgi:hypothetical protein